MLSLARRAGFPLITSSGFYLFFHLYGTHRLLLEGRSDGGRLAPPSGHCLDDTQPII